MIRTIIANLTFMLLYALAMRIYFYLRASREAHRAHPGAVALAALVGGAAFYLAQQIRDPHLPTPLDLLAFLIMAVAAAAIPLIVETGLFLKSRRLRKQALKASRPREAQDTGESA